MPAIAFGFKSGGLSKKPAAHNPLKRKAAFGDADERADDEEGAGAQDKSVRHSGSLQAKSKKVNPNDARPAEAAKTGLNKSSGAEATQFKNLSALRNAKLQDKKAAELDASVYDYDGVYDSFSAATNKKPQANSEPGVPKYMSNLLASAETRKRDQLRAKEKQLQKEREAEGDEFADKEKFVTAAYKQQQEENRLLEEAEREREKDEERRRLQGGGMTGFHKDLLRKDEERQRVVHEAQKANTQAIVIPTESAQPEQEEAVDSKLAAKLNAQGANIVTNEDGEVVDKRQLLTAGLNVAATLDTRSSAAVPNSSTQPVRSYRNDRPSDARLSQRERQSRMIEKQIEEAEARDKAQLAAEQQKIEASAKSKLSETDKMSAKERYLARKREREAQNSPAKGGNVD